MRLHATVPSPTEAEYDPEVWEATDSIDRVADALEAERDDWGYKLPERFQEAEVEDYQPLGDAGWDYQLPERFRF